MAFEHFVGAVEASAMLKERDKHLVLADHCNRDYEGEIAKEGDKVKVKGLGNPTVYSLQKDGTYAANALGTGSVAGRGKDIIQKGIPDAEDVNGYELELPVNQLATWNFRVGDIDKEQAKQKNLISDYRVKTGKKLADTQDKYIAATITGFKDCELETKTGIYTNGTGLYLTAAASNTADTKNYVNIRKYVDYVIEVLGKNGVLDSEEVYGECPYSFVRLLRESLRTLDTDNSKMIKGREAVIYDNITFIPTINTAVNNFDYVIIRTKDSVTFFDPLTTYEAYRPEKGFSDCLKGFNLYDAGIVEPKTCRWGKILGYQD